MASLRRMNSPLPREVGSDDDDQEKVHSHLNGANWTANPGSTASPKVSGGSKFFGSVPLIMIASGIQSLHQISKTSERSFKSKRRRCVVQVLVFFLVGLFWGFSPFGSVDVLLKRTDLSLGHPRMGEIEPKRLSSQDLRFQGFVGLEEEKILDNDQTDRNLAFPKLDLVPKKFLIIVTPTYNRAFQSFYLNRLGHTLRLVPPPLLWILVEIGAQSPETAEILRKSGVMYRHLVSSKNLTNIKDRGVNQRNTALEHIRTHRLDGIVYFADDDNLYSLELFEQIRGIRRFGTWPVAMLAQSKAKAIMEGPVCKGSEVIGWHTNEKSKRLRRFHVDMSGFAFNSTILWDPKRWHRLDPDPIQQLDSVKEGFQETTFIAQLVEDESQMEGLPNNCSKVMAWHLHMENSGLDYPTGWILKHNLDAVVPL